ncbi:hypothetical protein [Sutcliffiella sp. NC1]|uniref:hypothetical protein n=1 Tax=Sutcliffiella sp. NC1 TaxID=3004096 RepID=UPI0022DD77DA|nr:hypothetical protein [Sutcliffiella sp. NC1]WBL16403.1 hypothetical protein O1A01_07155 [Sutcliffiella sp. NC1]
MNLSNQRKQIQTTLINATSIIELAKLEGMTDVELLKAIELIKKLHVREATAPTAAIEFSPNKEEVNIANPYKD